MHNLHEIRSAVKEKRPLVHCITNPISLNLCANGILAVGARPIMAEHPSEVREITETADALLLNLGNITDVRMQSMKISLLTAREKGIPVIVDAVGIACSKLRRDYMAQLLEIAAPAVIKGNYSEILALHHAAHRASGVDADGSISPETIAQAAARLARQYHAVLLASGKVDVVTDGQKIIQIKNGTAQLSTMTGTGCLLGALCGAYLSVCGAMDAAATACAVLGVCGQIAQTPSGSGSFMTRLLDALSTLTAEDLEKHKNTEVTPIEKL